MRRFLSLALSASALFVVACAPPPPPKKAKVEVPLTDPGIDHDKGVDPNKARKLLARAEVALVKKDTWTVKLWSWGDLRIDPAAYVLRRKGDYVEFTHETTGHVIGKTQIKFNNGVYKRQADGTWKTSSLTSSWNGGFCLTDCFALTPVAL